MSKIYETLMTESQNTGWPVVYQTDLTKHDKRRIEGDPSLQAFGWVLRECGTELLDPRMSGPILSGFMQYYEYNGKSYKYYIYEKEQLNPVPFKAWKERLEQLHNELPSRDDSNQY